MSTEPTPHLAAAMQRLPEAQTTGRALLTRLEADALLAELATRDAIRAERDAFEAAMASTATDALAHRMCSMREENVIRRAEQAESERDRLRASLDAVRACCTESLDAGHPLVSAQKVLDLMDGLKDGDVTSAPTVVRVTSEQVMVDDLLDLMNGGTDDD
jgi:hypothetical protein